MRQIRRSGLATLMVTGGALALSAGYAHADSAAEGAAVGSPGVGSGNAVQLPVHVPVNVCGNTVNVVGVLNPAFGNGCANGSGGSHAAGGGAGAHKDLPGTTRSGGGQAGHGGQNGHSGGGHQGGSTNGGGANADGVAKGSPGVLSGNGIQLPVDLPVNVSGNSVNVVGIGNPAFGNSSVNGPVTPETPEEPAAPGEPEPAPGKNIVVPPAHEPHGETEELAETGANLAGYGIPASAALLLGGAILYRRSRTADARV
ncbi:chaplin family protein [Streptomyces sp. NPDC048604]|uniref:chaplin family protein n=1 Tax=Streptomyces sp. NPDC048604 TaxID=3365578 RepID=UPI0037165FBA